MRKLGCAAQKRGFACTVNYLKIQCCTVTVNGRDASIYAV